jgi:hypothetical protein
MDAKQNVLNLELNWFKSMELQFLGFPKGKPSKVVMDYDDYEKIAHKLNLPLAQENEVNGISGMEWYSLKESSHSIIFSLIGLTSREIMTESKKDIPDNNRISELKALRIEAWEINRNPNSFKDMGSMQAIIDKYSPILLAEKKKLN